MAKKLFTFTIMFLIAALALTACREPDPGSHHGPGSNHSRGDSGPCATTRGNHRADHGAGGRRRRAILPEFQTGGRETYAKIAAAYKADTGVTLKVVTAASGTYEQTLKSEIAKSDAPSCSRSMVGRLCRLERLLRGPVQHRAVQASGRQKHGGHPMAPAYMVSRTWSKATDHLQQRHHDQVLCTRWRQGQIHGGRQQFCGAEGRGEDMTAKKAQLGIKGVFSSTSLKRARTGVGRRTWPTSRSITSSRTARSISKTPPPQRHQIPVRGQTLRTSLTST